MKNNEYVVVDIETTGLSSSLHKITEIAAVRMQGSQIADEFQTLVNPQVKIPLFITRLTGITDSMVADAPEITQALPDFIQFLGNRTFVAHNATFDYNFLNENSKYILQKKITNDVLCTRRLAGRIFPEIHSKKLSCVCSHIGIINQQAHRALGDARATAQVMSHFIEILSQKGLNYADTLKLQKMPTQKCRKILLNMPIGES